MTGEEFSVIKLTFFVALITSISVLTPSVAFGWLLARRQFPGKSFLEALITLPLVAPPVVTGYMLLLLLGRNGLIGKPLFEMFGVKMTFNTLALISAAVVVSFPLAVRSMRISFEMVDPMYENVSLVLGKNPLVTFFRISLPQAMPGILSGMVLAFARSLGEFGATITLAGNIPGKTQTISTMVYTYMQIPGMEKQVAVLVIFSLVISFVAIAISENFKKKYSE